MTVVDVHAHYAPEFSLSRASSPGGLFGARIQNGTMRHPAGFAYPLTATDLDAREATMDRQGIDTSVLSLVPQMFFYDAGPAGIAYLQEANDDLAALVAHRPRFLALAGLPMQQPDAAADELRRAVERLGMVGAQIGTRDAHGRPIGHPEHDPVLATAEELGVPLMLHPSYTGLQTGLEQYYFTNTIGIPFETTVAGAQLIMAGALERFPRLRILLVHAGGFLPYQIGRLDHAAAVRDELRDAVPRPPSAYLPQLWFDSITHAPAALAFLGRAAPDRVVIGTDAPFDMGDDDPVGAAVRAGLDPHVLGRAATALFGDAAPALLHPDRPEAPRP